ncbi:MAG: hypothetical protein H6733_06040 [Alphaproteobacteria bacterium]|nr:hypothetical protein [Alphaproteobacteria bacterium]
MSNPFEAPFAQDRPPPTGGDGTFDVMRAFQEGLDATSRNWLPWFLVMFVAGFAGGLSFLMCVVPALFVIPLLTWGQTKFTLDAMEGDAEFSTLFDGFSKAGDVLPSMLGVLVLVFLANLPGMIVSQGLSLVATLTEADEMTTALLNLVGFGASSLWSIVIGVRFYPATYLVVDQGRGALDAFSESWNLTSTCWGSSMALGVAAGIATIVGFLLCCVGVIPAMMIVTGAQASMYRQLVGRT